MEKTKKTIGFSSVAFEITRKCNLSCEHCIRGDAQNMDMPTEVVDSFYDKTSEVREIIFTGGEPLLNIEGMNYVLSQQIKRGLPLYSLIFTTNGTIFNEDVIFCLSLYESYIMQSHMARGTDYKGSIQIYVSRDEWHEKQLSKLNMKENTEDIYRQFRDYFSYLSDIYAVKVADDGKEPLNMGRAKTLPADRTIDIDEDNVLHRLCLAGEHENLCMTMKNGFDKVAYPEKASTLVNCIVWLLCDGRLTPGGNMPYDYAYSDIISNVRTSHDLFSDVVQFNSRMPESHLCCTDKFWIMIGGFVKLLLDK